MRPKNTNFVLLQKNYGFDVMCNNFNQNKAIPAVFHNLKTEKYQKLGFMIIQSERFIVVYIDNLTKCHRLSSALRLALRRKTNKRRGRNKT